VSAAAAQLTAAEHRRIAWETADRLSLSAWDMHGRGLIAYEEYRRRVQDAWDAFDRATGGAS
jgi:hypothetical protein